MNNFMQKTQIIITKKGLKSLKKHQCFFLMGLEFINLLGFIMNLCMLAKPKILKKEFLHTLMKTVKTRRIKTLISLTNSINFIKTPNEIDSLILENNLIKRIKTKI